jgi:isoprenylcysteine carboxyl methyltransferase (ICMT) family protein YpbQ
VSRAALVVFGWGAFNALLAVVLIGYSFRDPFPIAVYWSAIAGVAGFATVVLMAVRRSERARSATYRTAVTAASSAFAGIAAALIGLSFVYGHWLALIALYPIVLTVLLARRENAAAGEESRP